MSEPTPPDVIQKRILSVMTEPRNAGQVHRLLVQAGYSHSYSTISHNLRELYRAYRVMESDVERKGRYKYITYKRIEKGESK